MSWRSVLVALALAVGTACTRQERPEARPRVEPLVVDRVEEQPRTLRLTWSVYDGTGDPERAVYRLGEEELGAGAAGLERLRARFATLPAGSRVEVVPYYGDPGGGVERRYPFDPFQLDQEAGRHGVSLLVQKGA